MLRRRQKIDRLKMADMRTVNGTDLIFQAKFALGCFFHNIFCRSSWVKSDARGKSAISAPYLVHDVLLPPFRRDVGRQVLGELHPGWLAAVQPREICRKSTPHPARDATRPTDTCRDGVFGQNRWKMRGEIRTGLGGGRAHSWKTSRRSDVDRARDGAG